MGHFVHTKIRMGAGDKRSLTRVIAANLATEIPD
jgi:hypothetical protein